MVRKGRRAIAEHWRMRVRLKESGPLTSLGPEMFDPYLSYASPLEPYQHAPVKLDVGGVPGQTGISADVELQAIVPVLSRPPS